MSGAASAPGPYVGMRPYEASDRRVFFGRSAESVEVARRWLRNRVTILCGPSGVGKTSLLQAGVIPQLPPEEITVLPVGQTSRRPAFPMAALPEQNPFTFSLLSSWDPAQSPTWFSGLTIGDFLGRYERRDRFGRPLPTLVVLDQAERIFRGSRCHDRWRGRFGENLAAALAERPETHLLVSVREPVLEAARSWVGSLTGKPAAEVRLEPFDLHAAAEAVGRPAERSGRLFEPEALEAFLGMLAADIGEKIEPSLLQAVCDGLWQRLPGRPGVISADLVRQYADVGGSFRALCARALVETAADFQLEPGELYAWLAGAFLAADGSGQPVPQGIGQEGALLRALEDRHLIRGDGRLYELLHPRLAESIRRPAEEPWPPATPDAGPRLRAAELAFADGYYEMAQRHAEAAAIAAGDDVRLQAVIRSFLGNVFYERGLPDLAEEQYEAAAVAFESLRDSQAVGRLLAAIGQLKLAQGKGAEAMRELHAAVHRVPNDPAAQAGLSRALWAAGRTQDALGVVSGVLTRDGDTPVALQARGEMLADLGEAESALRDLDRVDHLADSATRSARALALATLSHLDDAREELSDLPPDADSGPVLLRAAQVKRLTGATGDAADLAKRALKALNPPLPRHQEEAARRLLDGR